MRGLAVAVVIVLASGVPAGASGYTAESVAAADQADQSLQSDFNNDGFADLAIGVRGENVGDLRDAGAVNVLYGGAAGLTGSGSQFFTQDSPGVGSSAHALDSFGTALAAGDYDNDGFADLAVGVPGENVGSIFNAGAVNVLYGGPAGLTGSGSQFFTQDSPGIGDSAEQHDSFGFALTSGDFDNDGFADLVVSVLTEGIGTRTHVGAVNVLYGGPAGLAGSGSQLFTQDSPGMVGSAEPDDLFGFALTTGDFDNDGFADLAVGVRGEDIGSSIFNAGAVNVLYGREAGLTGSGSQLFTQNSAGAGSAGPDEDFGVALAAGDFDNDGFADLAVGVPGDPVGGITQAGAVNVLPGGAAGLTGSGGQLLSQDTPGVGSSAEQGDAFGNQLAASDFNADGFADLAVGVPLEAGATTRGGAVTALYGSATGLTGSGSQIFTQNSPGVGDSAELFDLFGDVLAASGT